MRSVVRFQGILHFRETPETQQARLARAEANRPPEPTGIRKLLAAVPYPGKPAFQEDTFFRSPELNAALGSRLAENPDGLTHEQHLILKAVPALAFAKDAVDGQPVESAILLTGKDAVKFWEDAYGLDFSKLLKAEAHFNEMREAEKNFPEAPEKPGFMAGTKHWANRNRAMNGRCDAMYKLGWQAWILYDRMLAHKGGKDFSAKLRDYAHRHRLHDVNGCRPDYIDV